MTNVRVLDGGMSAREKMEARAREALPFLLAKFTKRDDEALIADITEFGLSVRREALEVIRDAVNGFCPCGGRGPEDADRCPACSVWHLVLDKLLDADGSDAP